MRLRRLAVALVLACGAGCVHPGAEYVAADRATYEAIAPDHLAWARDRFTGSDLRRRELLLDSWRLRLEAAEAER